MNNQPKHRTRFYFGLTLVGLFILATIVVAGQPSRAAALPQSAYRQLQQAWQRAGSIGRYTYDSTILQTTHPTAKLVNVGRRSQTQRIRIQGNLDQKTDQMQMQLQVGQQSPIAVKIEAGQAYGRQGTGDEWIELERTPELFAPGGDPLGYLVAMEHVRELGPDEDGMQDLSMPAELLSAAYRAGDDSSLLTRYAFDLNGPKFARFMQEQMEAELRRRGELPPSMSLSAASQYVEMTGHGEIWVNADGLPIRQLIHIEFPPPTGADEWIAADITTSFRGWAEAPDGVWALLWQDPTRILAQPATVMGISDQEARQAGLALGMTLFLCGLVAMAVTYRRLRMVRATIYSLIILSMVFTPLLQSEQVSAFYDAHPQAVPDRAAQPTEAGADEFDPHENPVQIAMAGAAVQPAAVAAPSPVVAAAQTTTCVVTESSDCDSDGLIDQVEIHQLGTFVDDADTDNDFINDYAEVQPFTVGNQVWYLDPRSDDSNGDGLSDSAECAARTRLNEDGSIDTTTDVSSVNCVDTDGDSIPDVYDFDNDGDGVPDNADNSPFHNQAVTGDAFDLTLSNYQNERSIFVDFQIRPTAAHHLWWVNSYVDWPDNDSKGQVQRVTDETLSALGDMQLNPVLEITIPFDGANPTRGLPVQAGVDVTSISQQTELTTWLDMETLEKGGISVSGPDPSDGAVYAYIPLTTVEDAVGETPVALAGRMHYEMPTGASGWGAAHQVRLLWLVNGLIDSCEEPADLGEEEANTYCSDTANWTSEQTVIQSYYEDFSVTSLIATEDHGASAAVFAQKSAGQYYDAELWHLADVLQQTFLTRAVDANTGQRLSVENIDTHLSAWDLGDLYVKELLDLADELALAEALTGDEILTILGEARAAAASGETATLLFVGEQSNRISSLSQGSISFANNSATVNFAGTEVATVGSLRWSPYTYSGEAWSNADVTAEDGAASAVQSAMEHVFTDGVLTAMTSSGDPISDFEQARQGAALLAANYYFAQIMGASVPLAGSSIEEGDPLVDSHYTKPTAPVVTIVSRLVGYIQSYYSRISLSELTIATTDAELEAVANNSWAKLAVSPGAVLEGVGAILSSDTTELIFQELDAFADAEEVAEIMDVGALLVTEQAVTAFEYSVNVPTFLFSDFHFLKTWVEFSNFRNAIAKEQFWTWYAKNTQQIPENAWSADEARQLALEYSEEQLAIKAQTLKWAKIGLAVELTLIGVELAWTLATHHIPLDSVEFNHLIAETIAKVVWAVVQFVLITNPYTALFFAAIAVLDVAIAISCQISESLNGDAGEEEGGGDFFETYICRGITSYIIQGITLAINDTTLLMDLEKEDQFEVVFSPPTVTVTDQASGFAVGNTLTLSATITANAYAGHPNWMGYIYEWQLSDDNVKKSVVDFRLQESGDDFDNTLELGDTDWQRPDTYTTKELNPQPGKRFETDFQRTLDYTLAEAGVNVGLSAVHFSQAVKVKKQDCWLIPNPAILPPVIPVCNTEEIFDDTFHQTLEETFVMDIFPATLDGFHALVQAVSGEAGYRLAWDENFPVLADADGDGLVSRAWNGPDPDDSNPDTDGDGLSDFYEVQHGYDPNEADVDCDGLTDYWEAFYSTDPKHGDSDFDGLLDSQEVFHPNIRYPYENSVFSNTNAPACAAAAGLTNSYDGGWDIVYAFDGSTPLHYRVSADPSDPDTDDDGLTDRSERVYGYSPHAPSELDVLALETSWTSQHPLYNPYLRTDDFSGYGHFSYEATVTNDLTGRYLRGLLETEFPVDSVISTREIGILRPAESSTLTGTVNMDDLGITTSQVTSLTLRAGAIVDDPDDHLVWLHMNETAGAETLVDASVFGYDGDPSTVTLNGQSAYFPACTSQVTLPFVDMPADGITIGVWFQMTDVSNGDTMKIISGGSVGVILEVISTGAVAAPGAVGTTTTAPNEWHHAAVTITSNEMRIYLDGRLEATRHGMNLGSSQLFRLGSNLCNNSTYRPFYLDELEIFSRILSDAELLATYGQETVVANLESTGNGLSCSSGRCPTLDEAGATFNQTQHLVLDTSGLNFGNNQFSIALNIKPQNRAHPFNSAAGAYFTIDTSQDWQGVYGYEDPNNSKLIFPSLYVSNQGALRLVMGDGVDTCSYTTANGLVEIGAAQQVVVSYDGSGFAIYIDGVEKATGAPAACANVAIPAISQLYVGRPNAAGYLYFDNFDATGKVWDGVADNQVELRVNVDDDGSAGNIWAHSQSTSSSNGNQTYVIASGVRYLDDVEHSWLFWENDHGASTGCCDSAIIGSDDPFLRWSKLTNITLHAAEKTSINHGDGSSEEVKGDLYWSNSNEFFVGTLRNLRIYDYALSPAGAARAYNTETFALQMIFDEAPGETLFVDESGNYFEAACAGAVCPDSGIPGRHNQALRFDGGGADDDGNDGVADYLTLSAEEASLGLAQNEFTIMAWIKPDAVDGVRRILAAGRQKSTNGVGFGLRDGDLLFTTFAVKDYRSTQSNIPTGVWSHVAVSFDAGNDAHFYVNGQFVETIAGSAPANANPDDAYRIGATTISGSATTLEVFDGLIDDLRILQFAAGATTIQRMMNEAPLLNLHFDEDVDTTSFADDSLNSHAATCAGSACPGAGDKGQIRESVTFDGVDDMLTVTGSENLSLDTYSVALWVKPTQQKSREQPLVYQAAADSSTARTFGLFIQPDSMRVLHSLQQGDCGSYVSGTSVGSLLLNQWNHLVMTYDGSENRLYLNGALDNSVAYTGTPCDQTNPVRLGADAHSFHTPFSGNLDEVTVEGGALNASQVQAFYEYQSAWYDEKQQHTILLDADNPLSSLVLESEYIQPGTVLYIDAEDPKVNGVAAGIHRVDYNINGTGWTEAVEDDRTYLIPASATADLGDGSHTIQVRATDHMAHRVANDEVYTVQIDTVSPSLTGPAQEPNFDTVTLLRERAVTLYGRADDDQGTIQSGVDQNSLYSTLRDHRGEVVNGPTQGIFVTGQQWAATHRFALSQYGLYTLDVTVADEAGQTTGISNTLWLDGLPGYGDMLINSNIITGPGTVIGGLASDIPYPQTGRVLHMHFEEAAGATLFYDGSPNHLNATCDGSSCPTAGAAGQEDGALSFGGDDYLRIADQDGISAAQVLGLDDSFTIMAWVKPAALSGRQRILAAAQTESPDGVSFGLHDNRLILSTQGVTHYITNPTDRLVANEWQHVLAMYDAATNLVTFYIDGELLQIVSSGTNPLRPNTDDVYYIGAGTEVNSSVLTEAFSGAIDELVVYNTKLSEATIYDIANPAPNYTSQVMVRYRHASGVVWPYLDPDGLALYLPLDEQPDSDKFEDLSTYGREASCGGEQCPFAGSNSIVPDRELGTALWFDSEDDYLTVPHVLDPAATDFTASVWFKVVSLSEIRYILQQTDGSGTQGRTWFSVLPDGTFRTFLGGYALNHPTTVSQAQWHHAALTYDQQTQTLTLYLDGVPVSDTRPLESTDGEMLVGVHKAQAGYFSGNIDEVAIFDRALTATEIGHLGGSPWYSASPVYNSPEFGDPLGSTDKLRAWSHAVPEGLEGPYQIDLQVSDGAVPFHRRGVSHGVWTGEIDTLAPRVALDYALSADKRTVTISCAAADYNLSEEGWECPVDDANRSRHPKDAGWFTTIFSGTQKLAGFTTASEVFSLTNQLGIVASQVSTASLHVTACDLWGQCSTLIPEDTDNDGILDHVEGQGDRDGDGILDAHDYDPDGHFYELNTGRIITGGSITVSGPGAVSIDPGGETGYYDWSTDGTPGLYVMAVTPPDGYSISPNCPAQPGAITPSGDAPIFLGSSEVAATAILADASCDANPYYLQFNVSSVAPFVFNNNIPLEPDGPTALDPEEQPTDPSQLTERLYLPLVGHGDSVRPTGAQQAAETETEREAPASAPETTQADPGTPTQTKQLFLPVIGHGFTATPVSQMGELQGQAQETTSAQTSEQESATLLFLPAVFQ